MRKRIESIKNLEPFQKAALGFWILIILLALTVKFAFPEFLTEKALSSLILQNKDLSILIFLLIVSIRPLILIPGTVLVFVGLLVFSPLMVFILSMIGVVVSGTFVYHLSHLIGFDNILKSKYPDKVDEYSDCIEKYGAWFIGIWSAFPFVPDDLICYLAGALHFNYLKFIISFTVGGAIPIAAYSFGGPAVLSLIK